MSRRRNLILKFLLLEMEISQNVILKCLYFFVIGAGGFKFGELGVLVAVFQQLNRGFSCRLPFKKEKKIWFPFGTMAIGPNSTVDSSLAI